MKHEEAQELLAAYALDAVEGEERLDLEQHLEECVRCSSELDSLRGVTSAMGNVGQPAPPHVWQRISEHLYDDVESVATPPFRALESSRAVVTPMSVRRDPSSHRAKVVVGLFSAAAAALVAVLSINLVQANNHVSQLTSALGLAHRSAIVAAQATPGNVDVVLSNERVPDVATFVLSKGHGYLISSHMSTLSTAQTYQLWGIFNGKPISIGLMGAQPQDVQFTVASALAPSALAITIEPASGATVPTTPIIASGVVAA